MSKGEREEEGQEAAMSTAPARQPAFETSAAGPHPCSVSKVGQQPRGITKSPPLESGIVHDHSRYAVCIHAHSAAWKQQRQQAELSVYHSSSETLRLRDVLCWQCSVRQRCIRPAQVH
jgi:hypothetical protein